MLFGIKRLFGRRDGRSRMPKARFYRPHLEALECRLTPAPVTWVGTTSNWFTPENWDTGARPTADDIVKLGVEPGKMAPVIPAGDAYAGRIELLASFAGKTLTINGKLTVGSTADGLNGTTWTGPVGASNIAGTGDLILVHDPFFWTKGTITVGNIYIHSKAELIARNEAATLNVANKIYIGMSPAQGNPLSEGGMVIGGTRPDDYIGQYLTLGTDTEIVVKKDGVLDFLQDDEVHLKGGINLSGKRIVNEGKVQNLHLDVANRTKTIGLPIINQATDAKVILVRFFIADPAGGDPSFKQTAGKLQVGVGAIFEVFDKLRVEGGDFVMESSNVSADSTILGAVEVVGGKWVIGDAAQLLTVHITDSLVVSGSAQLEMNVNAGTAGSSDRIAVTGNFSLTKNTTTLAITRNNPNDQVNGAWDVITAGTVTDDTQDFNTIPGWTYSSDLLEDRYRLEKQDQSPGAQDDAYGVLHDRSLEAGFYWWQPPGLLGNDSDPDGDGISVVAVNGSAANVGAPFTLPSGATLTVNADGTFTYLPALGFVGQDSFTYTIGDGVAEATATVFIEVLGD